MLRVVATTATRALLMSRDTIHFHRPAESPASANLTPHTNVKPKGLTLEQFIATIRTGHDPVRNENLTIMPWPIYRNMTDRDLRAIYAYLTAIPPSSRRSCP